MLLAAYSSDRPKGKPMSKPPVVGVGAAIRQAREGRGLSRKELVERSGLSYPYLAQIEAGDRQPSTKSLVRIAEALSLRASELVAATEENSPPMFEAMSLALAAPAMQRWIPDEGPPPRRQPASSSRRPRGPRQELAELARLAADLEPADLTFLLELARRLGR